MKKPGLFIAVAAALAAGHAGAQSSVTISGTLDTYLGSRELSGGRAPPVWTAAG